MYSPVCKDKLFKYNPDFFARRVHFIEHLAPIWKAISPENKGTFYIPEKLVQYARSLGLDNICGLRPLGSGANTSSLRIRPPGKTPVVCCAYGDMEQAWHEYALRPLILMEHGVGLVFNHPGYAGGEGLRRRVSLFLMPNKNLYDKTYRTFPTAPQVIIGTPKMDSIEIKKPKRVDNPTIAISFHWDGSAVSPEAGNAFGYYNNIIPELTSKYRIIGHGHPKIIDRLVPYYKRIGVYEIERSFSEVMKKCDIYINDASSTLYEFSCTGKPVILLNAPWFRRDVHFGIRFWEYTDIGINVNSPLELLPAVERTIEHPDEFYENRLKMKRELYPYMGHSAKRAADAITTFIESRRNGTAFSFGQV